MINIHGVNEPKYIQIYRTLKADILKGNLKANQKLPSLRKLSSKLRVDVSTCIHSYALLEKEKLIYTLPGSGSYVSLSVQEKNEKPSSALRFDIGRPSATMFPLNDFKKAVERAMTFGVEELFEYREDAGYAPLSSALESYLLSQKIETKNNKIIVVSGAQQGLNLVAHGILGYGDFVFYEEPSYHGALEVFRSLRCKTFAVPLLKDGLDTGILKKNIKRFKPQLVYLMPNYQNPTGITYSLDKKREILNLADEYDFLIVEDDYLSDIAFSIFGKPDTLKSMDKNGRVIYIKSFSKILMPGLRIGFILIPERFFAAVLQKKRQNEIATPNIIQKSLYIYMKEYDWNRHLNLMSPSYVRRFNIFKCILEEEFKDIVDFIMPSGGFNAFFYLRENRKIDELIEFLKNKDIYIAPGYLFFSESGNAFRISVASFEEDDIAPYMMKLKTALTEFMKN